MYISSKRAFSLMTVKHRPFYKAHMKECNGKPCLVSKVDLTISISTDLWFA